MNGGRTMAPGASFDANVILIGMPASGKTVVGRLLARRLRRGFVDTDLLLERRVGCTPGELLAAAGREAFRRAEEAVVLNLHTRAGVIATGGSVIYSLPAVDHLRRIGILLYLKVDLAVLRCRGLDLAARGVVRAPGQDLESLYAERVPLYERFADLVIDAHGDDASEVAERVARVLLAKPH
ncbi:MAG: shikimate kinase [Candidatus Binatia bacterium]|nr:shikimate kinase [Candidatus Binatia bacterium]